MLCVLCVVCCVLCVVCCVLCVVWCLWCCLWLINILHPVPHPHANHFLVAAAGGYRTGTGADNVRFYGSSSTQFRPYMVLKTIGPGPKVPVVLPDIPRNQRGTVVAGGANSIEITCDGGAFSCFCVGLLRDFFCPVLVGFTKRGAMWVCVRVSTHKVRDFESERLL